ncbi:MAG: hypothetical protein KF861_03800 [Planctomycetaceae bacterium]|nr:hypothetical protein [Planctomycetaceae bacterium]
MRTLIEWEPLDHLWGDSSFLTHDGSFWIEHIAGGGPGWAPYTGLGGSVPMPMANGVVLFEGQMLVTNSGNGAGSIGIHRRLFAGRTIVGGGFWYDVTQSPNQNTFHQLGASLEWFPNGHWTFRANGYLPVGTRTENVNTVAGAGLTSVRFQGNNIISETHVATQFDDAAMRGYDLEAARNIGTWSGEIFCGYYNYHGDVGGATDGIKAGVRGYITPRLAGSITVSDDSDFATNVYGGLTWFFGGRGGKAPRNLCDKLTLPVERNPQIVINNARTPIYDVDVLTDGGQPITVTHVRSQGGGFSQGTWENPFLGLPPIQNTDIVYVHANSTFNGQSYVLHPGQSLLGEGSGVTHQINTDQLGMIDLPAGNGGANRPIIQNTPLGVQIASNSTISNFQINNATTALFADHVNGIVSIDRIIIEDGPNGIIIDDSLGTFDLTNVSITDSTAAALTVTGGAANVNVDAGSQIQQTTAGGVLQVLNGHTGTINFAAGSVINATNGFGMGFANADGQYNFNGTTTLNGGQARIVIIGGSGGTFAFGSDTSVTGSNLVPAFVVNDLAATAQIDYSGSLTGADGGGNLVFINTTAAGSSINFNNSGMNAIAGNGAGGIVIVRAAGDVSFNVPVSITDFAKQNFLNAVDLTGGSAVIVSGSSGTVTFTELNIDTTPFEALFIGGAAVGNTGTVNIDSGTIHDPRTHGAIIIGAGSFNLNNTTFTDIDTMSFNTIRITNSTVSGSGNISDPFSSFNGGGNAGMILFNNGANTAP